MNKRAFAFGVLLCLFATTLITPPAFADFCFQLNGGPFSGDIGFFRFKASRPKTAGKIETLRGRTAGLSPAFGTATVAKDGSFSEFAVTFFIDATQGQFDVSFFPPTATSGSGNGDYGAYGTTFGVTVNVVNCNLEP
ncbi:MAG TPA: hypothetical protein VGL70_08340 [Candidatus Binatia bacterium]